MGMAFLIGGLLFLYILLYLLFRALSKVTELAQTTADRISGTNGILLKVEENVAHLQVEQTAQKRLILDAIDDYAKKISNLGSAWESDSHEIRAKIELHEREMNVLKSTIQGILDREPTRLVPLQTKSSTSKKRSK